MQKNKLTIIVPVKNESESIVPFLDALSKQLLSVDIGVLFIDDGSTDSTVSRISELTNNYLFDIDYLELSRNFGKEAAMYAGLENADGEYVAFMDVDLQDPVELLPEMITGVKSGKYDAVAAKRSNRDHERWLRSKMSDMFYWVMNKIIGVELEKGERDYRVMNRKVVNALLSMSESKRFSKGMFHWIGFDTHYISYPNVERAAGTSSWTTAQLMSYAIDGIVGFSMKPLLMVSMIGFLLFIISLIAIVFIIGRAIVSPGSSAFGWASMVSIILFLSGLQLMAQGIIGRYIAEIFLETKKRPQYIVKSRSK